VPGSNAAVASGTISCARLFGSAQPERVRIARLVTRLGVGGVERHVCSLTANLDHEKFRSWLICGRAEKTERECLEFAAEAGVQPIFIERLRRNLGPWDISASFALGRILTRIKPQIVETHQTKAGAIGRSVVCLQARANRERPRLIHTFHCHHFEGYFKSTAVRAFIAIERQLARLTDMIITVTPTLKRQLVEHFRIAKSDRVRVVPLGFDFSWTADLSRHRGWLRARLGANDSTVVFGFVGRLTKVKNASMLLRAFARMRRNDPIDARLVLMGDGELFGSLQSLVSELKIDDNVLFCSWVLDRAKIFSDLDVTCLSSFNEGSPVCLIESLAAGIPVVATRVGGVADVVTHPQHGELVESDNEEAFAAALASVGKRRSRIPEVRSAALRGYYSTSRLIKDVESIYSEVLEGERAH
jgi:glycosyltransferase involved in cell wall biosynthesis